MSREDDVKILILNHNRRLQKLKEHMALYGPDPSTLLEVEEVNIEIEKLEKEVDKLRGIPPTITRALEVYLEEIGKSRSSGTLMTYHYTIEKFKTTLTQRNTPPAETPLSAMTNDWLQWFLDDLRLLEPTTERGYLAAIIGFYEYVVAKNWLDLNLTEMRYYVKRRQRKIPQKAQRFPKKQIEKLLQSLDTLADGPFKDDREQLTILRDRALLYLLADSGLRVSEACSLTRGHIDQDELELFVTGKGDKEARIRISGRSLTRLQQYLAARQQLDLVQPVPPADLALIARHDKRAGNKVLPVSPRSVQQTIDRWVTRFLGDKYLREITPHSFRHYFVTTVLRSTGGDIEIAKKLARHADISTTMRYAHLSDEELDKAYYDIFDD